MSKATPFAVALIGILPRAIRCGNPYSATAQISGAKSRKNSEILRHMPPATGSRMQIESIDHIVINVSDVERAAQWYTRVLGMRRLEYGPDAEHPRTAMLFGNQRINFRPIAINQSEWFTADQAKAGSDDLCFLTSSTPTAVVAHLNLCGVEIISGPEERAGALGNIRSVYCRDPDGSLIEISSYALSSQKSCRPSKNSLNE